METNALIEYDDLCFWNIPLQDLKLKEQPVNYKIKVTPETSEEVQELFFALGGMWGCGKKIVRGFNFLYFSKYSITGGWHEKYFNESTSQEITLPQLRDLVVLKRNDLADTTHEDNHGIPWFIGCFHYLWDLESKRWIKTKPINLRFKKIKKLENISVEVVAIDFECKKEMTWQDALDAVKDGKEVEVKNISWFDINDLKLGQIKKGKAFRLKPKTIHIDGGDYTKEDLLKIAGEME